MVSMSSHHHVFSVAWKLCLLYIKKSADYFLSRLPKEAYVGNHHACTWAFVHPMALTGLRLYFVAKPVAATVVDLWLSKLRF